MDTSTAILLGLDTWSSDSETEEKTGGLEEDGKAEMQTQEPDVRSFYLYFIRNSFGSLVSYSTGSLLHLLLISLLTLQYRWREAGHKKKLHWNTSSPERKTSLGGLRIAQTCSAWRRQATSWYQPWPV